MPLNFGSAFGMQFLAPSTSRLQFQGFDMKRQQLPSSTAHDVTISMFQENKMIPFTRQVQSLPFHGRKRAR